MKNYHCTIDDLDYLQIIEHDEGINFVINMWAKRNEIDFSSPAIVLTKSDVIRLINHLKELVEDGK